MLHVDSDAFLVHPADAIVWVLVEVRRIFVPIRRDELSVVGPELIAKNEKAEIRESSMGR